MVGVIKGLVISRRDIGEADRLVTLLTPDRGLIRAMAKGVRKIPSARGGHLEPLTRITATVSTSPSGFYIQQVQTDKYFHELRQDELGLQHNRRILLLLSRLFHIDDYQEGVYQLIEWAWETLPSVSDSKKQLVASTVMLSIIEKAGLLPDLTMCQYCLKRHPEEAVVVDFAQGSWRCLSCHTSFQGTKNSLTPRLFKVFRFMVKSPYRAHKVIVTDEEVKQLAQAVTSGVKAYV